MHLPLKGRWRPPDRGRGGAPDCFCLGALALSCHSLPPQTPTPRGACPPGPFWGTTPPNPNPNPPGLLPPGSLLGYHPTQSQTPGRGMTGVLAKPFGGVALTTDLPLPWAPVGAPPFGGYCADGWAPVPLGPGREEGCGAREPRPSSSHPSDAGPP